MNKNTFTSNLLYKVFESVSRLRLESAQMKWARNISFYSYDAHPQTLNRSPSLYVTILIVECMVVFTTNLDLGNMNLEDGGHSPVFKDEVQLFRQCEIVSKSRGSF